MIHLPFPRLCSCGIVHREAVDPRLAALLRPYYAMALTKSGQQTLYAIASTASNAISVGATLDVNLYYGGMIRLRMGRATGTAFTTAPIFRIEASGVIAASVAADQWVTIASFTPAIGVNLGSQAVSGTSNAGDGTLLLAGNTNFTADDFIFIHNTTIANSEWKHVTSISANTLTLQDNLVRAQTGSTARDQAEEYAAFVDLTGINSLRVVVDGATQTGQAVIVEAVLNAVSGL